MTIVKEIESLLFSSRYSWTNIVRAEKMDKKYGIFIERQYHSFFRLDANSSKLKVGGWSMFLLLNVFRALEGTV